MVVTREPEWDDLSQAKAIALAEVDRDTHTCGHLLEQGVDPDTVAVVERLTCAYCRAVDQVERADREKHKDHPERLDGVFWYARPFDPARDKAKGSSANGQQRRSGSATGGGRGRGRLSPGQPGPP